MEKVKSVLLKQFNHTAVATNIEDLHAEYVRVAKAITPPPTPPASGRRATVRLSGAAVPVRVSSGAAAEDGQIEASVSGGGSSPAIGGRRTPRRGREEESRGEAPAAEAAKKQKSNGGRTRMATTVAIQGPKTASPLLPSPPHAANGPSDGAADQMLNGGGGGGVAEVLVTLGRATYKRGAQIGKGTFGEVWSATEVDSPDILGYGGGRAAGGNREVALKLVRCKTKKQANEALREAVLLASLRHVNIVQLDAVGFDEADFRYDTVIIVMELCKCDLKEYIKLHTGKSTAELCGPVLRDVCAALSHLHARKILHRDVKLGNILVSPAGGPADSGDGLAAGGGAMVFKLGDFGVSRSMPPADSADGAYTLVGTPGFLAPEVAMDRDGGYGLPADIFSAGAVAVYLLDRDEFDRNRGLTARAISTDPALAADADAAAAEGFLAGNGTAAPPPPRLRAFVRSMCVCEPAARPDARACAEFFRVWVGQDA